MSDTMTTGLTFEALREANRERLPMFKNAKGETKHSGADWATEDWLVALLGELGEVANLLKKIRRGDFTVDEAHRQLAREFSDAIIYLDLLGMQNNAPLGVYGAHDFTQLRAHTRRTSPNLSVNRLMLCAFYHAGALIKFFDQTPKSETYFDIELASNIYEVLYYLDRLADYCGVNLDAAIKLTFNMKSRQLDLPLFLSDGGPIRLK